MPRFNSEKFIPVSVEFPQHHQISTNSEDNTSLGEPFESSLKSDEGDDGNSSSDESSWLPSVKDYGKQSAAIVSLPSDIDQMSLSTQSEYTRSILEGVDDIPWLPPSRQDLSDCFEANSFSSHPSNYQKASQMDNASNEEDTTGINTSLITEMLSSVEPDSSGSIPQVFTDSSTTGEPRNKESVENVESVKRDISDGNPRLDIKNQATQQTKTTEDIRHTFGNESESGDGDSQDSKSSGNLSGEGESQGSSSSGSLSGDEESQHHSLSGSHSPHISEINPLLGAESPDTENQIVSQQKSTAAETTSDNRNRNKKQTYSTQRWQQKKPEAIILYLFMIFISLCFGALGYFIVTEDRIKPKEPPTGSDNIFEPTPTLTPTPTSAPLGPSTTMPISTGNPSFTQMPVVFPTSTENPIVTEMPTIAPVISTTNPTIPTLTPTPGPESSATIAPTLTPSITPARLPSPTPNPNPFLVPPAPTPDVLIDLLSSVSTDNGASLRDTSSPQYAAMEWIRTLNNAGIYSDARFLTRYALATLYYSTNGQEWTRTNNWLSREHECNWFMSTTSLEIWSLGKTTSICDSTGNILRLDLSGNNLYGSLPAELLLLSRKLASLDISNNRLTGSIPTNLAGLTKLSHLHLSRNELQSSIPFELGKLTGLEYLNVGYNLLTGSIPSHLGQLSELSTLSLNDNLITGTIPIELANLSNLRHLYLDDLSLSPLLPPGVCFLGLEDFWADCEELAGCICCTVCCTEDSTCA